MRALALLACACGAAPATTVAAYEVNDYVYGGYAGDFTSPPHADGNPRRAVLVVWRGRPYRLVFWHEASYVPWIELASGAALSYQMFEGNEGWAELFNAAGRREENSFVRVLDPGPDRVWIRWTYFGVHLGTGERAYRAVEDFWAFPNGLVLRRQEYDSLLPDRTQGYAREPIEMIGIAPAGRRWMDVLAPGPQRGERHALTVVDAFSPARYDVYWRHIPGTTFKATVRRTGSAWSALDDSAGVAMLLPFVEGAPFCAFGDASGFEARTTRIKEHSHKDTGSHGWKALSWDHWPVGWIDSQSHDLTEEGYRRLPNHFAPAGLDLWALPDRESAARVYYSLLGVGRDAEQVRRVARAWLSLGKGAVSDPNRVEKLEW